MAILISSAVLSVAASGTWDVRPAAGVQAIMIKFGGAVGGSAPTKNPNVEVRLYDGSSLSPVMAVPKFGENMKLLINNAIYMRLTNTDASTAILSYNGVFL